MWAPADLGKPPSDGVRQGLPGTRFHIPWGESRSTKATPEMLTGFLRELHANPAEQLCDAEQDKAYHPRSDNHGVDANPTLLLRRLRALYPPLRSGGSTIGLSVTDGGCNGSANSILDSTSASRPSALPVLPHENDVGAHRTRR
jgi:hypothetical protein